MFQAAWPCGLIFALIIHRFPIASDKISALVGPGGKIIKGIQHLQTALAKNKDITMVFPAAGQSISDFVNSYAVSTSARSANHWIGTAKMGTDSGLTGGTSVVDTTTKVYGTNNVSRRAPDMVTRIGGHSY